MSVQRIASRYAQSLLELSVDQNKLERVMEDVQTFNELTKNRDFRNFIKSPLIHASKKTEVLHLLLKGKYDELTLAFLDILVKKGRENYMPEIAQQFVEQYKKVKHISTVRITTASELTKEAMAAITQLLEESSLTEKHVEISTQVNPELIGGFIIEFDDFVYDASVAHKLDDLRKEFAENLYVSQVIAR